MNTDPLFRDLLLEPYARDPSRVAAGRHHWEMVTTKPGATWPLATRILLLARGHADLVPLALGPAWGDAVKAYVDNNRWGARCECGGFETVDPSDPRYFCHSCLNVRNGGKPRPVTFPPVGIRTAIERLLLYRPHASTRTWYPWETVDDLATENLAHGHPVGP